MREASALERAAEGVARLPLVVWIVCVAILAALAISRERADPAPPFDAAPPLREVDPESGAAVGGGAGLPRLVGRPRIWNQPGPNLKIVAQPIEKHGEPCGTRTHDPLIKRSLQDRLGDDLDLPE